MPLVITAKIAIVVVLFVYRAIPMVRASFGWLAYRRQWLAYRAKKAEYDEKVAAYTKKKAAYDEQHRYDLALMMHDTKSANEAVTAARKIMGS